MRVYYALKLILQACCGGYYYYAEQAMGDKVMP